MEITIAGMDRGKPFAFMICSHKGFLLEEVSWASIGPKVEGTDEVLAELDRGIGGMMGTSSGVSNRIAMAMVNILQLQRQVGGIGVFGQMITVTRDGIHVRTICR